MEILKKIPVENLSTLRDIYKINYPLHVATQSTIQVFIDRVEKTADWENRVQFLSFENVWKTNGAFIMVQENRIFFNTLEEFPFKTLHRMLINLELEGKVVFTNIRDCLRSVIFDTIRINDFEVVSDIGTKSFLLPKEILQTFTVE